DKRITNARGSMADLKTGLHDAMDRARHGLDGMDEPIQQVGDVVAAIDEGRGDDYKGTLGRLVNDGELGEPIDRTTDAVARATAGFTKFRAWLGFRAEFNIFSHQPRYYAVAEIRAHDDKFYLIELEKSWMGARPGDSLTDLTGSDSYDRAQTIQDQLRFTF